MLRSRNVRLARTLRAEECERSLRETEHVREEPRSEAAARGARAAVAPARRRKGHRKKREREDCLRRALEWP